LRFRADVFPVPLLLQHVASIYLGPFDYLITHFSRGLNDNPLLYTFFTWISFTVKTLVLALIVAVLYLGGHWKEALVTADGRVLECGRCQLLG
jgi:hypothetical protein